MDKPSKKDIGELFKLSLANHEIMPSVLAWEKLEKRLDARKKPFGLIWIYWGAAAILILSCFGLYHFRGEMVHQNDAFPPLAKLDLENPAPYRPFQVDSINELALSPKSEIPSIPGFDRSADLKESVPSSIASNETDNLLTSGSNIKERRMKSSSIAFEKESYLDQNLPLSIETLPNAHHLEEKDDDTFAATESGEEMDYKVKIVSRGFAFQPGKENFVGEIENKIGHFFTKVDEGLAGIKDKKDHLFASLTTIKNNNK